MLTDEKSPNWFLDQTREIPLGYWTFFQVVLGCAWHNCRNTPERLCALKIGIEHGTVNCRKGVWAWERWNLLGICRNFPEINLNTRLSDPWFFGNTSVVLTLYSQGRECTEDMHLLLLKWNCMSTDSEHQMCVGVWLCVANAGFLLKKTGRGCMVPLSRQQCRESAAFTHYHESRIHHSRCVLKCVLGHR